MLSGRTATCQAHLRSHSGRNAGAALSHAPTAPEFTIPPSVQGALAGTAPTSVATDGEALHCLP